MFLGVLIFYISQESQDDWLDVDFECFKLELIFGQLWDRSLWKFEAFLLIQAINMMQKRSAIALRLQAKLVQAHNSAVSLTMFQLFSWFLVKNIVLKWNVSLFNKTEIFTVAES